MDSLVKSDSGYKLWEFNLRDVLRWCALMKRHKVVALYMAYLTDGFMLTGSRSQPLCPNAVQLKTKTN